MEILYIIGIILIFVVVSILTAVVYLSPRWLRKGTQDESETKEKGSKKTKSYFQFEESEASSEESKNKDTERVVEETEHNELNQSIMEYVMLEYDMVEIKPALSKYLIEGDFSEVI